MYCTNCGTPVPEGQKLCESCAKNYQAQNSFPGVHNPAQPTNSYYQAQNENTGYTPPAQESGKYSINPAAGESGFNPDYQQPYSGEAPSSFNQSGNPKKVVSTGQWILRSLITLIPCVGWLVYIIMLFVWLNDKTYEESSVNWAKAQLIWMAVSIGLVILVYLFIFIFLGVTIGELADEMYYM